MRSIGVMIGHVPGEPVYPNAPFRVSAGVGSNRLFVQLRAPPWTEWQEELAVLDLWHLGNQVIFPGHIIDIDFHGRDERLEISIT